MVPSIFGSAAARKSRAVSDPDAPFRLGRAVQLRPGGDVAVIACGALVEMAVRASDVLKKEGIGVRVLNMHTIKPLDRDAILAAAAETRGIVTAEEHHLTGGLGGAVAELLAVEHPTRMRMVGMPDVFAMVGPTGPLRTKYGMSMEAIVAACRALLGYQCGREGEGGAKGKGKTERRQKKRTNPRAAIAEKPVRTVDSRRGHSS